MMFNFAKSHDFPPLFKLGDSDNLKEVQSVKLLGVIIESNLKWQKNTDYICSKTSSKLWILRRLQKIGLEQEFLVDVYIKEIRSLLEFAAPVWHGGLTLEQSKDIEYIQRLATSIILNEWSLPYFVKCTLLNIEPLFPRRPMLGVAFAQRTVKSENHKSFFEKINPKIYNTRSQTNLYKEVKCNSQRCYNSPLPFLTRALNSHIKQKSC